jgi:hypothetical protein
VVKTTPENPFRPESLYCLAITKRYNPDALEEITGGIVVELHSIP